jgi:hypothetical protein
MKQTLPAMLTWWIAALGGMMPGCSPSVGPPTPVRSAAPRVDQDAPKAVIDATDHDLGVVDPKDACEHTFVIRNEGRSPLRVEHGGTSCKCTMSELRDGYVPPGKSVAVRVASKIRQTEGSFAHSATILTNDPRNPSISLMIRGTIRVSLAADPSRIVLTNARRGQTQPVQLFVYSQAWKSFTIERVHSSLPGIQWKSAPADPSDLARRKAFSGYRLEVTVPTDLPNGGFWEHLQVIARADDAACASRTLDLDVTGSVLGRITIDGPRLSGLVLQLGALQQREGTHERLTMKVRDNHRQLAIQRVETVPSFLQARVAAPNSEAGKLGLYLIDVEVPANAPTGSFLGDKKGAIRIFSDHPKYPVLTLEVAFAVSSG